MAFAIKSPPDTASLGEESVVSQSEIERRLKKVDEVILANLEYDEKKERMEDMALYKNTLHQLTMTKLGYSDGDSDAPAGRDGSLSYETDEDTMSVDHEDTASTTDTSSETSSDGSEDGAEYRVPNNMFETTAWNDGVGVSVTIPSSPLVPPHAESSTPCAVASAAIGSPTSHPAVTLPHVFTRTSLLRTTTSSSSKSHSKRLWVQMMMSIDGIPYMPPPLTSRHHCVCPLLNDAGLLWTWRNQHSCSVTTKCS